VAIAPGRPTNAQSDALLAALRQATLGDYEILAELGRGGMATVYLAHDLALDRKVAIKVLAPALLLMGEGMVERFKREARTAAALSHPHIIPIYAVKESDRVLYFVMKYVSGRTLESIIQDTGPLPIPMVQTIVAHVSDALSYAHRHGVIHRDIKSANIMLDEDGWAVVTDFGIAKVVQAQGLTMTGVTVGTPTYMSPEQCATEEVTGASDQYSLGVVAYEMLTGMLPFRGDSIMAVMYAHFNHQPRPVTELRADCPPNLAESVMRMLEKDPARRWPTLDDVLATCGRPSLRQDDPVRNQMITLAKAGGASRTHAHTPTSPLALAKPQTRPPAATSPRKRRTAPLWWGLAVAASAVALWRVAPWGQLQTPGVLRPATSPDSIPAAAAARAPADAGTAPALRESTPSAPPARPSPARRSPAPGASPTAPSGRAAVAESATRAAAQREDSVLRSLRSTAVAAMRRALEAGATGSAMAKGDSAFKSAESLAAAGRSAEAMGQLATAASLWSEAERVSRARAGRDTVPPRRVEPPPPPPVAQPPDPRAEIKALIAAYARALESRDLNEVRRVYPGLTTAEQKAFGQFFETDQQLAAALTINRLVITGASADAIVSAVYEYVDAKTGRHKRDTTAFRASLVQDSTGWHLTSIRSLP
jgi:serine/threonine-protein kinase